jgi:hypothetical protein
LPVAVGGGRACLATRWSPASVDLVGSLPPLIKRWLGGFRRLRRLRPPVDEDASRLLAQPALWLKPASLAGSRGDPWDVSRQMALPSAYPDSHLHDNAPQGKQMWYASSCFNV